MPDYDLTIDGKKQTLHWTRDTPPTKSDMERIVGQYRASNPPRAATATPQKQQFAPSMSGKDRFTPGLDAPEKFTSGPRTVRTDPSGYVQETRPSSLFTPKIASHIGRGLQADKFGAVLSSLLDPLIQAGSNVATGQRVTPQQAANVALMLAAPPQAKEAGSAVEGGLGFLRKKAMQVGEKSPLLGKALDVAPSIYQKVAKPVGRMADQEERIVARTSGRYAKGASNAAREGEIPQNRVQEHQRVPQGRNVPENKGKVRQTEGGRTGDSGRNVPEAQKPAKEAIERKGPFPLAKIPDVLHRAGGDRGPFWTESKEYIRGGGWKSATQSKSPRRNLRFADMTNQGPDALAKYATPEEKKILQGGVEVSTRQRSEVEHAVLSRLGYDGMVFLDEAESGKAYRTFQIIPKEGSTAHAFETPAKESVAPTGPKKGDILTTKKGIEFHYVGPEMKSQGRGRPRVATGEHVIQGVATGSKQTISAEEFAKLNPKTPEHTIQGKADQPITGVSERVRTGMAEEGRATPYEPGVGWHPQEAKRVGNEHIAQGANPEKVFQDAKGGKMYKSIGDTIAVLSAHDDALVMEADRLEAAANKNPSNTKLMEQAQNARKVANDWYEKTKTLHTDLSRGMVALQGEVNTETGEFSATRFQRFVSDLRGGKPLSDKETARMNVETKKIGELQSQVDDLRQKLNDAITANQPKPRQGVSRKSAMPTDAKGLSEALQKRLEDGTFWKGAKLPKQAGAVNISGKEIHPEVARSIWSYAKEHYIDPVVAENKRPNFDDMVNGVARDLGIDPKHVRQAFATNKSVRDTSVQMYRLMSARRDAITRAQMWARDTTLPTYAKAWRTISMLPMAEKIFGHGTVFMETHGGPSIMMPSTWKEYWPNFGRQFSFIAKPEIHEAAMQDLVRQPDFWEWKKAGLAVDPQKIYDSYQYYGTFLGKVGRRLNLGMDALKLFRYQNAEKAWNSLSAEAKLDPAARQEIALTTNHITGVADPQMRTGAKLLFAPSLEVARWQRYGDALKAAGTAINWKNATPAQRAAAKVTAKRVAEFGAVFTGALVANDQLLKATGQKDRVNLTDPSKSDFWHFKWGGKSYDPTGGTMAPAKLVAQVLAIGTGYTNPTVQGRPSDRRSAILEAGQRYASGKLNPAIQVGLEAASGENFMGRPLPFSSEPGTASRPKVGWGEFAWSEAPIPFAEMAGLYYDSLRNQGVDESTANQIVDALLIVGGTRVAPAPKGGSSSGRSVQRRRPSMRLGN